MKSVKVKVWGRQDKYKNKKDLRWPQDKDKDKKKIGEGKQASQVGGEAAITNLGAWHTFSTFEKTGKVKVIFS